MTFIDTNVFVYFVDRRDARKQSIARPILWTAKNSGAHMISVQVLNEFANVALKKLNLDENDVKTYVKEFANIRLMENHLSLTYSALEIRKLYGIQFFDALMLAAAEANGCDEILTEDLADGQTYCGVKAVNPFK